MRERCEDIDMLIYQATKSEGQCLGRSISKIYLSGCFLKDPLNQGKASCVKIGNDRRNLGQRRSIGNLMLDRHLRELPELSVQRELLYFQNSSRAQAE
jgi:hypothetical protein